MFISVLSFLLRLLFVLFFIQLIRRVWFALTGSRPSSRREDAQAERKRGQMFRDPICGMYIAQDLALTVQSGGRHFFFCSDQCRQEFLKKK
jgi:uncharacterized protein